MLGFPQQVQRKLIALSIFHSPNSTHTPPTPPPFIKGLMKFFKNGCNWEDGKFLLKMVRKPGMRGEGVGFIIGGWKIFKVSLHSWQRCANPLFYEDPSSLLNCLSPPQFFSNFEPSPHTHTHTSLSPPTPTLLSFSLAEWVIMPHLVCFFT